MKHRIKTILIFVSLLFIMSGTLPLSIYAEDYDCAAGKHHYTSTRTEPTKTTDGEAKYTCILCGHYYVQIIPATEHHWGEWIIDKEPSCTESGQRHHTCTTTNAPHKEYEPLPPLGHDYKETVKEPTCIAAGVKAYTCKRCGGSYKEDFGKPLGHTYKETITTPATAEKEGVMTFTCELCGDTYTEPIAKITEHTHQYTQSEIKATCETAGKITWVCAICNDAYDEILPALGHKWGAWIKDKNQNLTEVGHQHRVCENNSAHIEDEIIPKGITAEITPVAVAINIGSVILLIFSAITIFSEFSILRWERRERRMRAKLLGKGWLRL